MQHDTSKPALLICGYGTGISHSVAIKFGKAGHPLYLVARNADKLVKSVTTLGEQGIIAHAMPCDLSDLDGVNAMLDTIKTVPNLGFVHHNAFTDIDGTLLGADIGLLSKSLTLRVVHYLHIIQALLPKLSQHQGAVMATSGVMAYHDDDINAFAKDFGVLAVSVAAQHKANALLAQDLKAHGVHLAEVVVAGFVHNTPDNYRASIHPDDVADRFWDMVTKRQSHSSTLSPHH